MVWWITGVSISESNISANGQLLRLYLVPTLFSFSEGVLVCLDVVSSTLMHHFDTVVPLSPLPLSLPLSRPLSFFFPFALVAARLNFTTYLTLPLTKYVTNSQSIKEYRKEEKSDRNRKKEKKRGSTTEKQQNKKKNVYLFIFFFPTFLIPCVHLWYFTILFSFSYSYSYSYSNSYSYSSYLYSLAL